MDATRVFLYGQEGSDNQLIKRAWVYWRAGGTATLLRSDQDGRLWKISDGADRSRTRPRDYAGEFTTALQGDVQVYYSKGARPIPDPVLNNHAAAFFARKVTATPPGSQGASTPAQAAPNVPNTLVAVVPGYVVVPKLRAQLTTPAEEKLWPMVWELPSDEGGGDAAQPNYHTADLAQGAALWRPNGTLSPAENSRVTADSPVSVSYTAPGAAAAETIFIRPRERGLRIEGLIDQRATAATLRIVDEQGNVIQSRASIATDAALRDEAPLTLGNVEGEFRKFTLDLYPNGAVDHFGPIQLIVWSDIPNAPVLEAFAGHLCGAQVALVDDYPAAHTGRTPGAVRDERDEVVIVDFTASPEDTRDHLTARTRARRMLAYDLASERRALNAAAGAAEVLQPQMPLWMAEFQVVGLTAAQLTDLMSRRYDLSYSDLREKPPSIGLDIDLDWDLILGWQGIDANTQLVVQGNAAAHAAHQPEISRPNQHHAYEIHALGPDTRHQHIELHFAPDGKPSDKDGNPLTLGDRSAIPGAQVPPPVAAPFPVADRRLPAVAQGQSRPWGRVHGATAKESLIVEYQPLVVNDAGAEIIRGGDGRLTVSARFAAQRLMECVVPKPQEDDPDLRLPRFRIRGRNPAPHADVLALFDELVRVYHQERSPHDAWIRVLTLACWQETARRVIRHEGDANFETRAPTGRRQQFRWAHYGHQLDMPLFGPPHGYGFGQLDELGGRGASDDEVWSFVKNIETAVRLLMGGKGRDAYNTLSAHMPNPIDNGFRAVFQRELVRRYNGGTEFVWNDNQWKIQPSLSRWMGSHRKGPYGNLLYPNQVLGTSIAYWTYVPGPGAPAQNNYRASCPGEIPNTTDGDNLADQRYHFDWPITFINAAGTNYGNV